MHGAGRGPWDALRSKYVQLGRDYPHYVPPRRMVQGELPLFETMAPAELERLLRPGRARRA